MSFTDLQRVGLVGRSEGYGLWERAVMRVPELSNFKAAMLLLGITIGGVSVPALFGAVAQGAPVVALLTTVIGGLLLIWRANIERDAKHMNYLLKQRDREVSTLQYRLRKHDIPLEPTDE